MKSTLSESKYLVEKPVALQEIDSRSLSDFAFVLFDLIIITAILLFSVKASLSVPGFHVKGRSVTVEV